MRKEFFSKTRIILIVVLLGILGTGVYFLSRGQALKTASTLQQKEIYSCPMHPSIVSDSPGQCPICHMDLQKVDTRQKNQKILFYRHPMKPEITSSVPSKDEMGMDYIPVYEGEEKEVPKGDVEGRAGFTLNRSRQQLIGVTMGKAETRSLDVEIRASGKAAFDPDLFTAIEEYRQAVQSASQMKDVPYEALKTQAKDLVEGSRTKLRLFGLTDSQIRKLSSSRVSPMNLLLPKGNVWIYAEIFEYELPQVKEGQEVEVTSPAIPGKQFMGKITSISPIVHPQTRTARIRALVPDPSGFLRPDTFVNVRIVAALGEKLVIPADAVLHSGEDDFVFVVKGEGDFEPRKVSLGVKAKDLYEVLTGLSAGETVVTSANFLIDSESRLRGVLKNMQSGSQTPEPHLRHGSGP